MGVWSGQKEQEVVKRTNDEVKDSVEQKISTYFNIWYKIIFK